MAAYPTTFVGIDFNNMSDLGFRLDDFETDPDDAIAELGRAYLNNQITRGPVNADTDGDRITDEPYDVTLSLGRTFALANGATAVLVSNTILGEGTPEEVLVAPSNLEATAVSGTAIDVTFTDNSTDETGFSLERRTEPDGAFAPLVMLPANVRTYRDTAVLPGTTYTYRVQALFGTRGSGFSNEDSATTPGGEEGIRLAGPASVSISDPQSCYQASLTRDGAPAANVPILFELTGTTGNNTSSPVAVTTNSAGVAEFCFAPTTAGVDDLVACVDVNGNGACDDDEPTASIRITVTAPPNSRIGEVFGSGTVDASALGGGPNRRGTFRINATPRRQGVPGGGVEFIAPGVRGQPAFHLRSTGLSSLLLGDTAAGRTAVILGTAVVRRRQRVRFRVDTLDATTPGNDRFVLRYVPVSGAGAAGPIGGNLLPRGRGDCGLMDDIRTRTPGS